MIPQDLVLPRTSNEAIVDMWAEKRLSNGYVLNRFKIPKMPETVEELYRIAIALDVLEE